MSSLNSINPIDINCDMGEGFGIYTMGQDEQLLDIITSANIACGFHAGDPTMMQKTVRSCLNKGVAIGAHPGFPDLMGFGRREMTIPPDDVYALVLYQIGALKAMVEAEGGKLHHVKPHGALYNMASRDAQLAEAIAKAVYRVGDDLKLYGLPDSELLSAGKKLGLNAVAEGFIDRTYMSNGLLAPRSLPGANITSVDMAVDQAVRIAKEKGIPTLDGKAILVKASTLCVHGDGPYALEIAKAVRKALVAEGVMIRSIS